MHRINDDLDTILNVKALTEGPSGTVPYSGQMLRDLPSGDLFAWPQNAAMANNALGWRPIDIMGQREFMILSTHGGVRAPDGTPVALGLHTGHWELGLLVEAAANEFKNNLGSIPFALSVSDPCDGRTQGTPGMMDSLPYRNDAAVVLRRLARSLPTRAGVMGIATCDKGLPAMMMALAGMPDQPGILVPGGVTLPPKNTIENTATIQTIGARFSAGMINLDYIQEMGCKACGTPGGGCQFLGTAASAQVTGEALGMSLVHSALVPSGQPIWIDMAVRSAQALSELQKRGIRMGDIITQESIHNAMVLHAAFGGSTNMTLHIPAIAYAAGLERPTVEDWEKINKHTPRLVDVLPNHPNNVTVHAFMAGGVPEVMLHLRELGLLNLNCMTVTGKTLDENLDEWEESLRRTKLRERLEKVYGVDPDKVIYAPDTARSAGLNSTVAFPRGNLAPQGSIVKAAGIARAQLDDNNVYNHLGPARVFTSEPGAIAAIKEGKIHAGDVMVVMGLGPAGTGMEETYQLTSALKALPFGKEVALITDGRFSGVSTGACIGHAGPEALAGGPIGKVREGDMIEIRIDCTQLNASVNFVGTESERVSPEKGAEILAQRETHPNLAPRPDLPDDTYLWAELVSKTGGPWGGCVYPKRNKAASKNLKSSPAVQA